MVTKTQLQPFRRSSINTFTAKMFSLENLHYRLCAYLTTSQRNQEILNDSTYALAMYIFFVNHIWSTGGKMLKFAVQWIG